jgi:hypothetical protein
MNILKNCSNAYKVRVGSGIALFKNSICISLSAILLLSCAPGEDKAYCEKSKAVADSVSNHVPGIATDTINGITHYFIRNASVKCKVQNILKITRQVEQLANSVGGYITKSDLNSNKDYTDNIHFKKDSVLELTHYTSTSNIILRIPNKQLDSVLNKITDLATFVDYRTIHCDDVKMKLFANQLAERRYHHYKNRLQNSIDKKGTKLNHVTDAEENALEKQTMADNKRVESYDLADQVNYSTITLSLYQPQNTYSNKQVLPTNIEAYTPSFFNKLGASCLNGFELLKNIILFFADCWGLILVMITLYFLVRKIVLHFSKKARVHTAAAGTN